MSYKCKQCSKFYDYRESDYQTFGDNGSADGARNPKVQKLVNEIVNEDDDDDIPHFDGDEFSGKKTKSRETLYRMMKMLTIPEERWDRIATGVLEEEQAVKDSSLTPEEELPLSEQARNLLDIEMTPPVVLKIAREFSSSGDETLRSDDDDPFEGSEVKNLWNRFKVLHRQLLKDRKHENTTELIVILDTLLRRDLIDHAEYTKAFNKLIVDQRECTQ